MYLFWRMFKIVQLRSVLFCTGYFTITLYSEIISHVLSLSYGYGMFMINIYIRNVHFSSHIYFLITPFVSIPYSRSLRDEWFHPGNRNVSGRLCCMFYE